MCHTVYPVGVSDAEVKFDGQEPVTARKAALAYIVEMRRKDPNWDYRTDPTYSGPFPAFVELMSDAEYERHMAGIAERRQLAANPYAPLGGGERVELTMPRMVVRAALPFGQRIRDVRRTLQWSQREIAIHLGVSARSIIRYEQGRSAPLQSAPLLALRQLEAHAQEVDDSWTRLRVTPTAMTRESMVKGER
jgi:DNA-binding XRE family transcriptional regulator